MSISTVAVAVLSSTVASAIFTGLFSLWSKRADYVNEYYKTVLEKRIAAYELFEKLILNFKTSVPHANGGGVHLTFMTSDEELSLSKLLFDISMVSFWLSDSAFEECRKVGILIAQKPEQMPWTEFGARHYTEFASLRINLERVYSKDLGGLHLVPKFLNAKRHSNVYEAVRLPKSSFTE